MIPISINAIGVQEASSIYFFSLIGIPAEVSLAISLLSRIVMMTEGDNYCMDIMQQNLAVIGLLRSAHETLMENHLKKSNNMNQLMNYLLKGTFMH